MKGVDLEEAAVYESEPEATPMFYLETVALAGTHSARPPLPAIRLGEGVNDLAKPARFKQGIVTVSEGMTPKTSQSHWILRYIDPTTGKDVRRRVTGLDRDEVKDMADNLTRRAYQGKGYLAGQSQAPTLQAGIVQAVRLSTARSYVKTDMLQRAKSFLLFIDEQFPLVKTWADLRPGMVETYLRQCEADGLAYDTIRMRLAPVKMAWRRMHDDWPELVRPLPRLRLAAPPRREIQCLEPHEVAMLLDWLKEHQPNLWPMACLQGLAGLRSMEAAALRIQDVDLKAGTVCVTDTGHHRPKTRDSWRTIPVCEEILAALRWTISNQKVRPASGELFVTTKGNQYSLNSLSQAWRRALDHIAAEPKEIKRSNGRPLTLHPHGLSNARLGEIPARKLRAAFATMASRIGVQDRLLKAYLGHSAGDMLGGHYRRISLEDLRPVSELVGTWRRFDQDGAWQNPGNNSEKQSAEA